MNRATLLSTLFILLTAEADGQFIAERLPDYKNLPDRTVELQSQLKDNSGRLQLNEKFIRITRPIDVDAGQWEAVSVKGDGTTTIIMDGPGPAFRVHGTHRGTAAPKTVAPDTRNQRMPVLSGFEVTGTHKESDAIELNGTMQAIVRDVTVTGCRHSVHLVNRNRNVIISSCQFYDNTGIGVFLDGVNLHQINVTGCHISYNRDGGVVVHDGNVRNLQVTGCDIEENMPVDGTETTTANVLIDLSRSSQDPKQSVAEVSITGCTIQHAANYSGKEGKPRPVGGANIRIRGKQVYPVNSVTITGNLFSDTETNVDLSYANDVTVSANSFFAPFSANVTASNCERVILNGNTFNPRQFVRPGTIQFTDCHDCILSSSTLRNLDGSNGGVFLNRCSGFIMNAITLSECDAGIQIRNSEDVLISGCRVRHSERTVSLHMDAKSRSVRQTANLLDSVRIEPSDKD